MSESRDETAAPRAQQLAIAAVALGLWAVALVWALRAGCGAPVEDMALPAARLDLNSADAAELEALPGVGRSLARKIVEDRAFRGPFGASEDLLRVRGVTRELFERIAPHIEVRAPTDRREEPGEGR